MNRFLISIGGAHSGCGKTHVAELLLRNLKGRWGAIKHTKTAFYTSISEENTPLKNGKDTQRMLAAGAKRVLWLQSPEDELSEALPVALDMLSDCSGVIIEGNSAIEFLSADIVIFVFGRDPERLKKSAHNVIKKADFLVYNSKLSERSDNQKVYSLLDKEDLKHILKEVMDKIQEKNLQQARQRLIKAAKDGKISCAVARKIAEEFDLPYKEIGNMANKEGIKIKDCELGCF